MRTGIISGGNIHRDFALSFLRKYPCDRVITADRGLLFCHDNGIRPQVIVGDFDSLEAPGLLEEYKNDPGIAIHTFNPVKDATDTEIAIRRAIADGTDDIVLLGGTGSRLDHCLGNIQCLHIAADAGVSMTIADPHNRITLLEAGVTVLKKEAGEAGYVSFFPAGRRVKHFSLTGFHYDLTDHTLRARDSLTVSNQILAEQAKVSFPKGRVIMIRSCD